MGEIFEGRSARSNPADPYFPLQPDGFECYSIRQWRRRVTETHMATEGVDG